MANDQPESARLFAAAQAAIEDELFVRAADLLTKAMALEPENPALVESRGAVRAMNEDFGAALADFTRALEMEPRYAEAYLNRGLTYRELGLREEALRDLDAAVRLGLPLEELELQARYFLAREHEAAGDIARAREGYLHIVTHGAGTPYGSDAATRSLSMQIETDRASQASGRARGRPGAKKTQPKKRPAAPTKTPVVASTRKKSDPEKKATPRGR